MVADPSIVDSVLAEYGQLTRELLKEYLPQREPRRYLWDLVADYPNRGGKMLRPSLCVAASSLFGANIAESIRTAVSIELLHNALLVHDDIEDESEERRGREALHIAHGIPMAINAGDTLSLLSLQPLIDNIGVLGPRLSLAVLKETERMGWESAEGQAMELGWRFDNAMQVTTEDYLLMVLKKTCWLTTIYPIRVGALIGSRGRVELDRFLRFGFFLGAAFQIQDDILNLVADQSYGKERDGDLWEGKRTIILIRLIELSTEAERKRIAETLKQPREEKLEQEVNWMRERIDHHGCLDYARQFAHGVAGAAHAEFQAAFAGAPHTRDRKFIEALTSWVFERGK